MIEVAPLSDAAAGVGLCKGVELPRDACGRKRMKVAEVTLIVLSDKISGTPITALVEAALSALKWNAAVPTGKEGDRQERVAGPLKARSSGSIRSGPWKMPFGFKAFVA